MFFGNPFACVANADPYAGRVVLGEKSHHPSGWVANCVLEQIRYHLTNGRSVRPHPSGITRNVCSKRHSVPLCARLQRCDELPCHCHDIELLGSWHPSAWLDSRQIEKIIDDSLHPLGVRENHRREFLPRFRGRIVVRQRLGESTHDGEWCSKLVRHVRDEIATNRLQSAEFRGESFERHRKVADFASSSTAVARPCGWTRNRLRCVSQLDDWPGKATRKQSSKTKGKKKSDETGGGDITSGTRKDRIHRAGADGHAREAVAGSDGNVDFFIPLWRAGACGGACSVARSSDDLRAVTMVGKRAEWVAAEFWVSNHHSRGVHDRHAPVKSASSSVGQWIGVRATLPLLANESRFSFETRHCLGDDTSVHSVSDNTQNRNDQKCEDGKGVKHQPPHEPHLATCPLSLKR